MGLGRVDKLHTGLHEPTQGGLRLIGAPLALGRATSNTNTQDSARPELGGNHHLPPYNILYGCPWDPHPNGLFVPGLPIQYILFIQK